MSIPARRRHPEGLGVLFAVKLTTNTAARFVYAFLPAIARGLGVSLSAAGVLASVRWVSGAATPLALRGIGTENRRRVAAAGAGLFGIGALVTAVAGVYAGAIVGFALMGLAKPLFDTAAQAFVSDRVPYPRRARTVGVLEATWALGFLVGAPLAGWLIARWGWTAPFWVTGVVGLALLIPVLRVVRDDADVPVAAGSIRWDRASVGFLTAGALVVGSAELIFITFAAWLESDFGFSVTGLAALATAVGVAELAAEAATVLVTDRLGKSRAVVVGLLVSAAAYLVVAAATTPAVVVTALIAGIAGFEFAIVSSISLGTELQPTARMAFLARFVVAQAAGRAVAAVGGVALFEVWGRSGVGVSAALAAVAAALVMGVAVREHGTASPSTPR